MHSRIAGWVLWYLFKWASRNVSFKDFQIIWNEAYAAHVEAEWTKLKATMGPNPTFQMSLESTSRGLDALEDYPAQKPNERRYGPIC